MTRLQISIFVPALAGVMLFAPATGHAQISQSEMVMRLDQLESRVRELTGTIEQLQYRNQQLEQQVLRIQQDAGARAPTPQTRPTAAAPPPAQEPPPMQAAPQLPTAPPSLPRPQRRGDVFDPNQSPTAPGAPRTLGALPSSPGTPPPVMEDEAPPPVGAPGGRQAGAPLDLSTMSHEAANDPALAPPQHSSPVAARPEVRQIPGVLPPPPPRNPSATGGPPPQQMVMAPSQTPRDEYDLAYGYMLRKDYALAEDALRAFLAKYPSDGLVADASYWLGESLFQRQRYREAAESFLAVSTKFGTSRRAPDALLRLGQSLAALKEREAACATFGEIPRKFPKASASVKQATEREQKRVGC